MDFFRSRLLSQNVTNLGQHPGTYHGADDDEDKKWKKHGNTVAAVGLHSDSGRSH